MRLHITNFPSLSFAVTSFDFFNPFFFLRIEISRFLNLLHLLSSPLALRLAFINYLSEIENIWPGPSPTYSDSSWNDNGRGTHQGCLNPAPLLSINNCRWKWSGFPGGSDQNKFHFSIIRIDGGLLHIFHARLLTNNWASASRKVQRNGVSTPRCLLMLINDGPIISSS